MAVEILKGTVELEVKECPTCFVVFGVPKSLLDRRLREGGGWYCPNGHCIVFSKSEVDKLRAQLARAQEIANGAQHRENIARQGEKQAWAVADENRKQLKRLQRRTNAGICPHCNRTFQNVGRHIGTKHPEVSAK